MSRARSPLPPEPGPFRLEQVPEGSRYELSDGHSLYCSPAGRDHGRPHTLGALPLSTDPAVTDIGTDVGHVLGKATLRAPDLSVGALGEGEGVWAKGAPPLAIEYAAHGQDEADLQKKVGELLAGGSHFVWVVRLAGPRRVEIYERGRKVQVKQPGERLEAPGILKNAVPVEALYDREAAFKQALQNLLERQGYASLDAVRAEGEAAGRAEGEAAGRAEGEAAGRAQALREAVADLCELLGVELGPDRRARIASMGLAELEALRASLKQHRRWPDEPLRPTSPRHLVAPRRPLTRVRCDRGATQQATYRLSDRMGRHEAQPPRSPRPLGMRGRLVTVSLLHEALVELFDRRPELLPPLVEAAGLPLPPFATLRTASGEQRQLLPVEARADGVVLLGRGRRPVFALVLEVQLGKKARKLRLWPLYQAAAHTRYRCPAAVVVITPNAAVARWASVVRSTGQPRASFAPVVLGPNALPRLIDPLADPYLVTLSALAHGNKPGGVEVAKAAFGAAARLPEDEGAMLGEVLWASLGEAVRKAVEAQMDLEKWKKHSVLYREGKAEGKAEGLRVALVDLCEVLGIALGPKRRTRLEAMTVAELEALRASLKQHRRWPAP